jgi:hypothetical protein
MSYLSDTFGVPLKNQFTPQDTQVTPESLLAPQQPFGQPNAIGVSQQTTPPYLNAAQPPAMWPQPAQGDQYNYAPNDYAPSNSADTYSPNLARLGVSAPSMPDTKLSEDTNTPGLLPSQPQLLDLPVRDQAKESKRLTNAAGVGGLIGLLLGGGQGAIQGASSAMQGGGQALDFAAQSAMQKASQENQKRLQDSALERQSWQDRTALEDQAYQREFALKQLGVKTKAEQDKLDKERRDSISKAETEMNTDRNQTLTLVMSDRYKDPKGGLTPEGKELLKAMNARVLAKADVLGSQVEKYILDPDKVLPSGDTLSGSLGVAKLQDVVARGKKLGIENDFLVATEDMRKKLLDGRIDKDKAELRYKDILNKYLDKHQSLSNQQLEYVVGNLPTHLGLADSALRSLINERNTNTEMTRLAGGKVNPINSEEFKSLTNSMSASGWADLMKKFKGVAGITANDANILSTPGIPQSMKNAVTARQEAYKASIQSAVEGIKQRADAQGFKNVTYDEKSNSWKFAVPDSMNPNRPRDLTGANHPKGFEGAYNPSWKPSDLDQFNAIKKGTHSSVTPLKGEGMKIVPDEIKRIRTGIGIDVTQYGYPSDPYMDGKDHNTGTYAGIGNGGESKPLMPGDVAVSDDVRKQIAKANPNWKINNRVSVIMRDKDGNFFRGNFRVRDSTATEVDGKPINSRFDIFTPAGETPYAANGMKVVAFLTGAQKEPPKDINLTPVPKGTVAPKAAPKVQSSKPNTLSSIDKRMAEITAQLKRPDPLRD